MVHSEDEIRMLITASHKEGKMSGAMEDHVASRARLALRNGLITRADNVWAVIDGQDVRIPIASVTKGQILHLNAGSVLPVDGSVVEGEGELNEASMTGYLYLTFMCQI